MHPNPTLVRGLIALAATASLSLAAAQQAPISTASYPLFGLGGSDVIANLQVSGRSEGGSRFVLSLADHDPERTYRGVLYEGNCGPDREVVLELAPVGLGGDPYVSTTNSDLAFEEIARGDLFLYVFEGDAIDRPDVEGLDGTAVACGEVGAGAVR